MEVDQELDNLADKLKSARERKDAAKVALELMKAEFEAQESYQKLKGQVSIETLEIDLIEGNLRLTALELYRLNGQKNVHRAVSIKSFKTFKIVDRALLDKWVRQNLADALVIDEGKVKDYALKIGAVEGTETGEEPRAVISIKL